MQRSRWSAALALSLAAAAPAGAQQGAPAPATEAPDVLRVRIPTGTALQVSGARMPDGSALHSFRLPSLDGHLEMPSPVRTVEPAGWEVPLYRTDTRLTVAGRPVPLEGRGVERLAGDVVIESSLLRATFADAEVETFADSVVIRPRAPAGGR